MMPLRSLSFPPPPPSEFPDAPPADLLEAWLPELLEEHRAMVAAVSSARDARNRFDAAAPAAPGFVSGGGADWVAAVASDAAAVRRKHKPEGLASLIAETPTRYGAWYAREVVAADLVGGWNGQARGRVTSESRSRLVGEEQRLRITIGEAAEGAVRAAADVVRGGDVLRAAWKGLSEVDELAERWRPTSALLAWVGGGGWQAPTDRDWPVNMAEGGVPTMLGRALALRDGDLRRQLELLAPAVVRA